MPGSKSWTWVVKLALDLDQRVRDRVHRGELPLRVALLLLPLRHHGRQWRLASTAIRRRLTVVQIRRLVKTALVIKA